jgi:hypothetical protein
MSERSLQLKNESKVPENGSEKKRMRQGSELKARFLELGVR